ncbi:DUF3987 domain-containing protein [Kitasatospora sp. NPDC056076]|uniref:DUF3987 domain-containing protein n=1 Tax=Kitasatospora sp. NPDC056076 TaxID=3345703 RepID=UPI0035DE437E
MSAFESMKFGPLGDAVEAAMPTSEADPIGVWAGCLSLFSSAISRAVRLESGRPVVVWTVLAGRSSAGGKGTALATTMRLLQPAIGGFLSTRTREGVSSGPSLVDMLNKFELETAGQPDGIDGRALLLEEEWAEVLKLQRRCPRFSTLFRKAWDGKTISNRTKKEGLQAVARPLLGFHAHITPGEWAAYVSAKEALGGSLNRLLPVLVERSKMLAHNQKPGSVDVRVLRDAYEWAVRETRIMEFERPAGERYDEIRALVEDRMAELPELLASYMERAAEQVYRIAAVLTATTKRTKITRKAVDAAWAFVQYSMHSVEKLVKEATDQGGRQLMKSTEDLVREVLARYDGEATSTMILRTLGTKVTAASLKETTDAMPDVEVVKRRLHARGAPATVYRLVEPEPVEVEQPDSVLTPIVAQGVKPPVPVPIKAKKVESKKAGKSKKAVEAKFSVVPGGRPVGGPAPTRKVPPKPKTAATKSVNPFLSLL